MLLAWDRHVKYSNEFRSKFAGATTRALFTDEMDTIHFRRATVLQYVWCGVRTTVRTFEAFERARKDAMEK